MEKLIEHVSEGLIKKGFSRRDRAIFVWRNLVVSFRERDTSFLAYQKTTELEEFEFFDLGADEVKNHYQLVLLLEWVRERQRTTLFEQNHKAA